MLLTLLREWMMTPFTHYRLFHNFAKQDFLAQFTASIGGFLWLIITPIIHIMIYAFVFGYLFKIRSAVGFEESTFVVFMMVGYLPWFAFADAIGKSTGILIEKAPLITKVKFPVQIIPVVGAVIPYLTHAIGFGILLVYLATQGSLNWMWFYLPFIFFFQFLFTLGLVAILSALSVFLRDLQQLVALGITVWFFLTPIIWPISIIEDEAQRDIFLLNPMHSFVSLYREIVLQGQVTFIHLQIIIPVSLVVYFFGGWLFMKIKQAFGDVL